MEALCLFSGNAVQPVLTGLHPPLGVDPSLVSQEDSHPVPRPFPLELALISAVLLPSSGLVLVSQLN